MLLPQGARLDPCFWLQFHASMIYFYTSMAATTILGPFHEPYPLGVGVSELTNASNVQPFIGIWLAIFEMRSGRSGIF